jgi:hypothetical protein
MLYRDTDISRQLAGERHAELKQEWRPADSREPAPVERSGGHRLRFAWLRWPLRSNGQAPARHAS